MTSHYEVLRPVTPADLDDHANSWYESDTMHHRIISTH